MTQPSTSVPLGDVAQTLMIPLWSRAIESARPGGLLDDPKAQQIVATLDYDFEARYAQHRHLAFRACLRTVMVDRWVNEFIAEHPRGMVVELGTGLNTRFERVDNGRIRWFDVDLPDALALRRRFFEDGPRRTMLEGDLDRDDWIEALPPPENGPVLFIAEAVLVYLEEQAVRRVFHRLARRFPGARIVFDTVSPRSFAARRMMRSHQQAPFVWGCDDPRQLERWDAHRLLASVTMRDIPASLLRRLPLRQRLAHPWLRLLRPQRLNAHALNLLELRPSSAE